MGPSAIAIVCVTCLSFVAVGCSDVSRDAARSAVGSSVREVPGIAGALPSPGERALRVVDGDTLVLDGLRHRLFGIDAPEANAICVARDGALWRCGDAATVRLRALVNDAYVTCAPVAGQQDRFGREISRCLADGVDVADALVRDGLAWAFRRYSDEHVGAEQVARSRRAGVWQAPNTPAWVERAQRRNAPAAPVEPPDPACRIKGNISGSGRIYHLPGSRDYDATRIATTRGERWFCSEPDARAAGWRARR